jgi:hypothetical protein
LITKKRCNRDKPNSFLKKFLNNLSFPEKGLIRDNEGKTINQLRKKKPVRVVVLLN